MQLISQNPTDEDFIQDPYKFYKNFVSTDGLYYWNEYNMPAVFDAAGQELLFKDKRFGREKLKNQSNNHETHLKAFYHVESNSMLELEPPKHTRLRGLVLRAFTTRKINTIQPEIAALSYKLLDDLKSNNVDILKGFATQLPVIVIARLLGVPETMAQDLLSWSNDMVMMYQARRTEEHEARAVKASQEFSMFMKQYVNERRNKPEDDLITHLISAEEDGEKLTTEELITTCILLLNAGHEATVHSLGNGIKALIENKDLKIDWKSEDKINRLVEEILRFDPPLHIFTRYAYEQIDLGDYTIKKGEEVALVLGATGRDKTIWEDPCSFDPDRTIKKNTAFGGGIHFCVGAALARLEMQIALPMLFKEYPYMEFAEPPRYANVYHFHGLEKLSINLQG